MEAPPRPGVVQFSGFCLDRRRALLARQNGGGDPVPVRIGSRALDVLGLLIDRHGDVVSKDDILNTVWPGVVEGANVTVQISALRRVLDEGRSGPSLIQTVPGRGYRFVEPVTRGGANAAVAERSQTEAPSAPRLSIIVLPFTNLSDDREQQYFADGITEDLTTDLSRIAHSFVISRNTAFTYRNKFIDTRQIGRELGVRYVLEGSVRRSGNRVRINAQLIDAETDKNLWADRFDRDLGDFFALQNEITGRIANALNLELVRMEATRPTDNPEALDYIFRGRAENNKGSSREAFAKAIDCYERALTLDPGSVEAQCLLAGTLATRVIEIETGSAAADIVRAAGLIERALATSPLDPLAHHAKGLLMRAQNRPEEAMPEFETVLAFDPNSTTALHLLGWCKFLTGSIDEVIPLAEQAIRLNPRDPFIANRYVRIGMIHLLQSRTDEAIIWLEKARNANPRGNYTRAFLASAYSLKGEPDQAVAELAEARRLFGDDRLSSIARLRTAENWRVPKIRALFEATHLAGLRKIGVPEE